MQKTKLVKLMSNPAYVYMPGSYLDYCSSIALGVCLYSLRADVEKGRVNVIPSAHKPGCSRCV